MHALVSIGQIFKYFVLTSLWFGLSTSVHSSTNVTYPSTCEIAQYEVLSAYHELSSSPKQEVLKRNLNANNKVLSDCIQLISGQLGADDATQLVIPPFSTVSRSRG